MTLSYSASSRMTSEFYSSYNSPEFFYNQSAYSILKKPSSFSNSSKSVSFASTFSYQRIFLTDNWSYQYPIVEEMKDADLFMAEDTHSERQIVGCKLCHFIVFVDKWQYANSIQAHFNACSDCLCVQDYKAELEEEAFAIDIDRVVKEYYYRALARFEKEQKEDRQAEQARLAKERAELLQQQQQQQAEKARQAEKVCLIKEHADHLFQQVKQARLAEQARIEKAQAEEARLVKKRADRLLQQQQAEEARIEKERAHRMLQQQAEEARQAEQARIAKEQEEVRLTAFACRRCSAKFSSNTKFHHHIEDHHVKKAEKSATSESAVPAPSRPITSSESTVSTPPSTPKALTPESTSKAVVAMPTPPATSPPPSEPALLLTPFVRHPESISDNSLSLTSSATSIETPRKPIS